jgi:Domain of unknown function (DUF4162)
VNDPTRARAALSAVTGVSNVTAFGPRLHVTVEEMERDLPSVIAVLRAAGVEPSEPRRVMPSLEDVFIAVIQGARGATRDQAA